MIQDANVGPSHGTGEKLFFNTAVLARFMRTYYGANAVDESQRHVAAYTASGQDDLVEIWKRVVVHLHGVELKEDTRRIIKSAKPLRVRADGG